MSNNYFPLIVNRDIPWSDMLTVERVLLFAAFSDVTVTRDEEILSIQRNDILNPMDGVSVSLACDETYHPVVMIEHELLEAALDTSGELSKDVRRIVDDIKNQLDGNDLSNTGCEVGLELDAVFEILQAVVQRSDNLEYIDVGSAFYGDTVSKNSLGGFSVVITKDQIVQIDTSLFVRETLRKAGIAYQES